MPVDLSRYDGTTYSPGRPFWIQALWFFAGLPLLRCQLLPLSSVRRALLRAFGSKIGKAVVLKPGVRVKYPWFLEIDDDAWIGEDVWIDNLGPVRIGRSACLSQGAYLCTGNHDWTDPRFGLRVGPITIGDSAWVGAKCFVGPGVVMEDSAVAAAGSIVSGRLAAGMIYAGNPLHPVKPRNLRPMDQPAGSPDGTSHQAKAAMK